MGWPRWCDPQLIWHLTCAQHPAHIDGLVQERRNSIANALELHLSCTNPSIYRWLDSTVVTPWLRHWSYHDTEPSHRYISQITEDDIHTTNPGGSTWNKNTGLRALIIKAVFRGTGISIIKIKRSWDHLIQIMVIPTLVRQYLYTELVQGL